MKEKRPPSLQEQIDAHVPVDRFTSSNVRSMSRLGVEAALPYIISIAKGEAEDSTPAVSIRAFDILGKYSLGEQPDNIFIERRQWLTPICELAAKHFKDHATYNAWCTELIATLEQMQ